jgi:hypothetical protein
LRAAFLGLRCDSLPEFDIDILQPYLHPQLGNRRFLTACVLALRCGSAPALEAPFRDEVEALIGGVSRNEDRLAGSSIELPMHRRHRGRWNEVRSTLLQRRATRVFEERALLPAQRQSLHHVLQCALDYTCSETLPAMHAFVIEAQTGRAAAPQIARFGGGVPARVLEQTEGAPVIPTLLGQHFPNRAPFIVIVGTDLAHHIRGQDHAANRYALHLAGLVVGQLWIAAELLGLAGTAIGAVLLDGVCASTGANGYDEAPLLGFCAGWPAAGTSR